MSKRASLLILHNYRKRERIEISAMVWIPTFSKSPADPRATGLNSESRPPNTQAS